MGRYYDMVKANYNKLRNDESAMWGSVEIMDKHLEEMMKPHPEKYWQIMRATHELIYGKHFDKEYGEWQVSTMHHKCGDKTYKGEHWSIEETTSVMTQYRAVLSPEVTPYDFYVALNSEWHDYHCWAKEHFAVEGEMEGAIIDGAVRFWFRDDDWPTSDKVWCYFALKAK